MRVIFETENAEYRIVEHVDTDEHIENLKGDTFNPEVNSDIPCEQLKKEEREFEELVNSEGVYSYVLERWNPDPGVGYEHVDSCWGFVGQYAPEDTSGKFNHCIVTELLELIPGVRNEK